jgi:hypothetical protein
LVIQADYSDYGGSVIIQGPSALPTAGLGLVNIVSDVTVAGNLMVINHNTYGGTITFGGTNAVQTAGTLTSPAPNWTSTAGTLTMGSSATTMLTSTSVLTLSPDFTTSGSILTLGSSPRWLISNGEISGFAGGSTISGGILTLSNGGTLTLIGSNSGGQGDGTVPEPAAALVILIASMTLLLQRGCSLPRA